MKNIFKKTVCILLTLILMTGIVPLSAAAMPEAESGHSIHYNPFYEHLYNKDEVERKLAVRRKTKADAPTPKKAKAYNSINEAAKGLRNDFKARRTDIQFVLQGSLLNADAEKIDNIVFLAFDHTGVSDEGDYLLWQYGYWNYDFKRDYSGKVTVQLYIEFYTSAAQEKEVNSAVKALLPSLSLKGKNDYEKIKTIYRYICDNVVYDNENVNNTEYTLQYTAYAALIQKVAVCQGYSLLFYRLALESGIDARIITSFDHAWNIVKLGKVYYNIDSTWDAGYLPQDYSYFLCCDDTFFDHLREAPYNEETFKKEYPVSKTDYGTATAPNHFEDKCGDDVYWEFTVSTGVLEIYGSGSTDDFTYAEDDFYRPSFEHFSDRIRTVTITGDIVSLGNNLFNFYPVISKINFNSELKAIGQSTFSGLYSLQTISLPPSLEAIGFGAFAFCTKLKTIDVPKKVYSIGAYAFYECESFEKFTVDTGNKYFSADSDGVLYSKDKKELWFFPSGSGISEYVIPSFVNSILFGAFATAPIKKITIGKNVEYIEAYAFADCVYLEDVTIYAPIEAVPESAFEFNTGLKSVTLPSTVKSISLSSFDGCEALQDIYFLGHHNLWHQVNIDSFNEPVYNADITCIEIDKEAGDINKDGKINSSDALQALRHAVSAITLNKTGQILADVNCDGKINSSDALLILKRATGMISHF